MRHWLPERPRATFGPSPADNLIRLSEVIDVRTLPLATSLLFLASTATASGAQQTVRLRLLPPVGQVTHYRMTTRMWMRIPGTTPADTAQLIMEQTEYSTRTIIARKGGMWTARTVVDSSQTGGMFGTLMGKGDAFRGMVIRQTFDSLGRMDSSKVTPPPGAPAFVARGSGLTNGIQRSKLSFPARPVRVGESWTDSMAASVPLGHAQQSLHGRITFRLERLEREGKDRVAVISSTMPIVGTGAAANVGTFAETGVMNGTYRLDLDAGRLLDETMGVDVKLKAGSETTTVRSHSEIRRLK